MGCLLLQVFSHLCSCLGDEKCSHILDVYHHSMFKDFPSGLGGVLLYHPIQSPLVPFIVPNCTSTISINLLVATLSYKKFTFILSTQSSLTKIFLVVGRKEAFEVGFWIGLEFTKETLPAIYPYSHKDIRDLVFWMTLMHVPITFSIPFGSPIYMAMLCEIVWIVSKFVWYGQRIFIPLSSVFSSQTFLFIDQYNKEWGSEADGIISISDDDKVIWEDKIVCL